MVEILDVQYWLSGNSENGLIINWMVSYGPFNPAGETSTIRAGLSFSTSGTWTTASWFMVVVELMNKITEGRKEIRRRNGVWSVYAAQVNSDFCAGEQ
jgi:hypothetical protein